MLRSDRLRALLDSRPLVCDGATGTQLQALGLPAGGCGERWNAEAPERVARVHRDYVEAGADLVTTNTFGGTALALAAHGLAGRAAELNRAGARLAREAAGDRAFVLGDVGPFGGFLEPLGDTSRGAAAAAFREQAAALLDGGADAILVETMSDPVEAAAAVEAARDAGAPLVFASFSFQHAADGFRTMMGAAVADVLSATLDAGADGVGANCGTELSLEDHVKLARELVAAARGRPVLVQPNAGSPQLEDGRAVYRTGPDSFAAAVPRLLAAGCRIVGGCCGTGPAHVAAVAAAIRAAGR